MGQAPNVILRTEDWRKGKRRRNKGKKKSEGKERKKSVMRKEQKQKKRDLVLTRCSLSNLFSCY
jgi:hypothetical protein